MKGPLIGRETVLKHADGPNAARNMLMARRNQFLPAYGGYEDEDLKGSSVKIP